MSTKRVTSSSNRKAKRTKLAAAQLALGQADEQAVVKGEDELALEEAVFGVSAGGKGSVWDVERLDEEQEFVETGLERLEDDNVSALFASS